MDVRLQASILHLGRDCDGEHKRVQAWIQILEALGVETKPVPVSLRHRNSWGPGAVARHQRSYVPEGNLWNVDSLMEELNSTGPDIVVGVTSRCWHPRLNEGNWKLVLDFVDSLSMNYKIRSTISKPSRKVLFNYLARAHTKAENNAAIDFPDATFVYAGYREAQRRGAQWVPNLPVFPEVDRLSRRAITDPPNDLVFFGALYTPINVDAVEALARTPQLRSKHMMLAGRRPSSSVVKMAREHGWNLTVNFPSPEWLAKQAKVAVVPLGPSTGIQNKVLDAAAVGLPQAVTQSVMHGFEPGFPLAGFPSQHEAINQAIELASSDPAERYLVAEEAREYVLDNYTTKRWAPACAEMIGIDEPSTNTVPAERTPVAASRRSKP